ncbi:hypothetical protein STEG23_003962, partial [Scotinomys teguina]
MNKGRRTNIAFQARTFQHRQTFQVPAHPKLDTKAKKEVKDLELDESSLFSNKPNPSILTAVITLLYLQVLTPVITLLYPQVLTPVITLLYLQVLTPVITLLYPQVLTPVITLLYPQVLTPVITLLLLTPVIKLYPQVLHLCITLLYPQVLTPVITLLYPQVLTPVITLLYLQVLTPVITLLYPQVLTPVITLLYLQTNQPFLWPQSAVSALLYNLSEERNVTETVMLQGSYRNSLGQMMVTIPSSGCSLLQKRLGEITLANNTTGSLKSNTFHCVLIASRHQCAGVRIWTLTPVTNMTK